MPFFVLLSLGGGFCGSFCLAVAPVDSEVMIRDAEQKRAKMMRATKANRLAIMRAFLIILIALLLQSIETDAFSIGTRAGLARQRSNAVGRISSTRRWSAPTDIIQVTEEIIPTDSVTTDAIICGGGPAGLLTAIMLAQTFPEVRAARYSF